MERLRVFLLAVTLLLAAVAPSVAGVIFSDNFDRTAYTDKWNTNATLNKADATHAFGAYAAMQDTDKAYLMKTNAGVFDAGVIATGQTLIVNTAMYDQNIRSGNVYGSIGLFGTAGTVTEYYQIRATTDSAAPSAINYTLCYGTVNGSTPLSWATTTIARTEGWHNMSFQATSTQMSVYVDGVLGLSIARVADTTFNSIRLGLYSPASSSSAFWYDNVEASIVPEPASLLALGAGLVGMFGAARRRFNK